MADEDIVALCCLMWVTIIAAVGAINNAKKNVSKAEILGEAVDTASPTERSVSQPFK
jgi:hypothetical protein